MNYFVTAAVLRVASASVLTRRTYRALTRLRRGPRNAFPENALWLLEGLPQLDASSIDSAVDVVHNIGFDAPGADLLVSKPLDPSTTDVTSGAHIGMTFIDRGEVHQLAFRGTDVDWQLWVTAGDKPLPLRYVVTTKKMAGAPEFTLQLRNWNTAPQIDPERFTFSPPAGAKKLDPASVTVNALGDLTLKGQ